MVVNVNLSSVAWSIGAQLMIFFCFRFPVVMFGSPGSPTVTQHVVSLSTRPVVQQMFVLYNGFLAPIHQHRHRNIKINLNTMKRAYGCQYQHCNKACKENHWFDHGGSSKRNSFRFNQFNSKPSLSLRPEPKPCN